jgi:hypothetical protein
MVTRIGNGKGMGEIREKFRLTNALDEMPARRGEIPLSLVRFYAADALVSIRVPCDR